MMQRWSQSLARRGRLKKAPLQRKSRSNTGPWCLTAVDHWMYVLYARLFMKFAFWGSVSWGMWPESPLGRCVNTYSSWVEAFSLSLGFQWHAFRLMSDRSQRHPKKLRLWILSFLRCTLMHIESWMLIWSHTKSPMIPCEPTSMIDSWVPRR